MEHPKTSFLIAFSSVLAISLIAASPSSEAAPWSSVAGGCTPEARSISKVDSNAIFGIATFRPAKTGRIRFTCPITGLHDTNEPGDAFAMNVSFYDPDARGATCEIRATLLRANLDHLERGNTIVSFSSTSTSSITTEPGTGKSVGSVLIPNSEPLDFNASYYWIDLEILRSNTSCNPTALGVYLTRVLL